MEQHWKFCQYRSYLFSELPRVRLHSEIIETCIKMWFLHESEGNKNTVEEYLRPMADFLKENEKENDIKIIKNVFIDFYLDFLRSEEHSEIERQVATLVSLFLFIELANSFYEATDSEFLKTESYANCKKKLGDFYLDLLDETKLLNLEEFDSIARDVYQHIHRSIVPSF